MFKDACDGIQQQNSKECCVFESKRITRTKLVCGRDRINLLLHHFYNVSFTTKDLRCI